VLAKRVTAPRDISEEDNDDNDDNDDDSDDQGQEHVTNQISVEIISCYPPTLGNNIDERRIRYMFTAANGASIAIHKQFERILEIRPDDPIILVLQKRKKRCRRVPLMSLL
jgi:hypothetical protein